MYRDVYGNREATRYCLTQQWQIATANANYFIIVILGVDRFLISDSEPAVNTVKNDWISLHICNVHVYLQYFALASRYWCNWIQYIT